MNVSTELKTKEKVEKLFSFKTFPLNILGVIVNGEHEGNVVIKVIDYLSKEEVITNLNKDPLRNQGFLWVNGFSDRVRIKKLDDDVELTIKISN